MNIGHGVLSLDVGGLERIVLALARGQVVAGHTVTIVCIDKPGTLAAEAERAGVNVISLNKPPGRPKDFASVVSKTIATLQLNVLHTHQIGAAWHLAPVAKSQGVRVIHTEHGNAFARSSSLIENCKLRFLMRRTARSIDRFCCVSEDIATAVTTWGTVPKSKVEVVPNGIAKPDVIPTDIREKLGIPAAAKVVGTVGRLHEVKQQHILLHAVAKLPGVWALLVGDGPERRALEKLTAELGINDRTIFAGYQSEPWGYLQAMDIFALTSRSEGFPVSLLEAWALGKPVVCSAVGGLKTIVTDFENGLLVPSGNVPAFAEAIRLIIGTPDLTFGIAGEHQYLTKYTFDIMSKKYLQFYFD